MSEEEVAAGLAKHLKKQAEQHQAKSKVLDGKLKRLTAPQRWADLKAWIKKTIDLTNKGTHAEAVKVYTIGRNEMRVEAVCRGRRHSALVCFTPSNGNIAYAIDGAEPDEFLFRSRKEDVSAEDLGKDILHRLLGIV
jgi:hypothetical protein